MLIITLEFNQFERRGWHSITVQTASVHYSSTQVKFVPLFCAEVNPQELVADHSFAIRWQPWATNYEQGWVSFNWEWRACLFFLVFFFVFCLLSNIGSKLKLEGILIRMTSEHFELTRHTCQREYQWETPPTAAPFLPCSLQDCQRWLSQLL